MSTYVGIFREEEDLKTGIKKLEELKEKVKKTGVHNSKVYNPGWHLCRDLRHMLIASEAIARSALSRKESRGAHSRLDYPNTDEALGKENTSVYFDGREMKIEKTPLPEMPEELKELFKKKEAAHA
jgi:succinate dehydrogenase / fumarate reductase flavoprotein subunit